MIRDTSPGAQALILAPKANALVQNLGPFRSGRLMETDILPKSALVCLEKDGAPEVNDQGYVRFTFEGNANGAVNLERFYERCIVAAGRLRDTAPSIAYGYAKPTDLEVVARFNMTHLFFEEVSDATRLEEWSGERLESYLPDRVLAPCRDQEIIRKILKMPYRQFGPFTPKNGGRWLLLNGQVIRRTSQGETLIEDL